MPRPKPAKPARSRIEALAKFRSKRLRTILDFDAGIWRVHADNTMTCLICGGRAHDPRCWFKRAARTALLLDQALNPEWYRELGRSSRPGSGKR